MSQIDGFTDKWNNVVMSYYDHYGTMARTKLQEALEMKENIIAKGYALLEKVANEHLARISEQLDTITGVNNWKKAQFTTEDELIQICMRINVERVASEANYDDYIDEIIAGIEESLDDWDNKVDQALQDVQEFEVRYAAMIKDILGTLFTDVYTFVDGICNQLDYALENVCAYRNVEKVVSISTTESLGSTIVRATGGVSHLTMHRWRELDVDLISGEADTPNSLPWNDAEEVIIIPIAKSEADRLSRNRWVDVGGMTHEEHTEDTPLVPWYDAE
jgi:hypothetical protein